MTTALSTWGHAYVAKKAMFAFLGPAFRIYGPEGNLQFFVKQKAFKLKEEITVYADEAQKKPRLTIKARSWSDISATYDVVEVASGEAVGALQRKGLKSLFRDEWHLLDPAGTVIGTVKEDTGLMSLIRRFLIKVIPQTFEIRMDGTLAGQIKQRFNPFQLAYDVDFKIGDATVEPRLGIATVVLLLAIEGRQQ